jgi:hypothetical protein
MVILEQRGQAERDREQPRALRRQVVARGVGPPHDHRDLLQRRIVQAVFLEKRVEAAPLPLVAEFDARDVVRHGPGLLGDGEHALGRHVEELGLPVDEPCDQPRAGDPVDLWPLTGDPSHGRSPCLLRMMRMLPPTVKKIQVLQKSDSALHVRP